MREGCDGLGGGIAPCRYSTSAFPGRSPHNLHRAPATKPFGGNRRSPGAPRGNGRGRRNLHQHVSVA